MSAQRRIVGWLLAALCMAGCRSMEPGPEPAPRPPTAGPATQSAGMFTLAPLPHLPEESDPGRRIGAASRTILPGMAPEQVRAILGSPTHTEAKAWTYLHEDAWSRALATIHFKAGKVAAVESSWSPGWQRLAAAGDDLKTGDDQAKVLEHLGEPLQRAAGQWCAYHLVDFAPSSVELYFDGERLAWGSVYLLSRLRRLPPGAGSDFTREQVRDLLGAPVSTVAGAVWTYQARGDVGQAQARIHFRAGRVHQVQVYTQPTEK